MHAPMKCFRNVQAYYGVIISYESEIFIKLTPGGFIVKTFVSVIYELIELENMLEKTCQGQTVWLITKTHKLQTKKDGIIGPG
jgi:hypothetical protein